MSKLLERLSDPSRSGVYRTRDERAILDATRGATLDVAGIDLQGSIFEAMARALDFPEWFGGNWDALEDVLGDLSWRAGDGHVFLFHGQPRAQDFGILLDVLASSTEFWRGRGKPFFAVFIDPEKKLPLPDLYREA
jgi:hypothetical protein